MSCSACKTHGMNQHPAQLQHSDTAPALRYAPLRPKSRDLHTGT